MGHRALVAYERPDGTYNIHYSHWGGCNLRLKHDITDAMPFGGSESDHPWTTAVFTHLQTATTTDLPEVTDSTQPSLSVDPEPLSVRVPFEETISEHVDYQTHEAFYVVPTTFEVTAYRTFWLGFSVEAASVPRSPTVGHGVLLTIRWYDGRPVGDGYLRGWFDGAKSVLATFIDRGVFTESQATTHLITRLLENQHSHVEYHIQRRDQ